MNYSLLFALLLLVILIFSFAQVYLMAYIAQGVMRDMRLGLLRHTMGLPLSSLSSRPVGSLVSRLTGDVETVNELFTSVATSLFRDFFMMFGVVAVLFSLNVRLAWITCLSLPPVLLLTWFFRARAREAYRKVRLWVSEVNGFLSERVAGMEIVQMFGREEASSSLFGEKNRNLLKANLAEMYVFALFRPLIDLLTSVSIGVIVYFGARLFTDSALTLGVLIAFINLIEKFYQPVKDLSEKFNILQSAMAGSERVFDLLDSGKPEGAPGAEETDEAAVVGDSSDSPLPACEDGSVIFHGVEFSYNPEEPVLKGLSFILHPGETVAVVGYTGAGKTTIANLMARFYEIQGGQICLGGEDIRHIPLDQLRRRVQTVQQEVFLFSGTLKENISLGKELTDRELRRALETVKADKFVDALPLGLDTPVKEGGVNFSAGQRQLISFARIIAHEPEIVILDEATASIDTETEKLIQEALVTLLKGRTSLVIAHRLSTIQHADRIMVLNEGLLVEEGTHGELMARRGAYYNLYRLQYEKNQAL
jgi:ATP-binding cassette subfamily B protein